MSQAYQRFTARGPVLRAAGIGRMTCSGVRGARDLDVEDAPGLGHPLVPFFSPVPVRLAKVRTRCTGALAAAAPRLRAHRHALAVRRDHQRRQVLPLLPGPRAAAGARARSWQNRSAPAAAAPVICSSCRLPILTPVAASTNSRACS